MRSKLDSRDVWSKPRHWSQEARVTQTYRTTLTTQQGHKTDATQRTREVLHIMLQSHQPTRTRGRDATEESVVGEWIMHQTQVSQASPRCYLGVIHVLFKRQPLPQRLLRGCVCLREYHGTKQPWPCRRLCGAGVVARTYHRATNSKTGRQRVQDGRVGGNEDCKDRANESQIREKTDSKEREQGNRNNTKWRLY